MCCVTTSRKAGALPFLVICHTFWWFLSPACKLEDWKIGQQIYHVDCVSWEHLLRSISFKMWALWLFYEWLLLIYSEEWAPSVIWVDPVPLFCFSPIASSLRAEWSFWVGDIHLYQWQHSLNFLIIPVWSKELLPALWKSFLHFTSLGSSNQFVLF